MPSHSTTAGSGKSFSQTILYIIYPAVTAFVVLGLYFSGKPSFEAVVAPRIEGLSFETWRQLGMLETFKHLYILAAAVLAFGGARVKTALWERRVLKALGFCAMLLFLEEIDYGIPYYEFMNGVSDNMPFRNLHSWSATTDWLKAARDAALCGAFLLAPFALARRAQGWVLYLLPSRWFMGTVGVMLLTAGLAFLLQESGLNAAGPMSGDLSEFRELTIWYILFLYAGELATKRKDMTPCLPAISKRWPSHDRLDRGTALPPVKALGRPWLPPHLRALFEKTPAA